MPLHSPDALFCPHHNLKVARVVNSSKVGEDVFDPISGGFVPANALTQSLSRVIGYVADGTLSPKAATAISRVADTLLKTIALSTQEFREAYVQNYFNQLIRNSFGELPAYKPPPPPTPITRPAPVPANPPTKK
jgi:hypothetical protein